MKAVGEARRVHSKIYSASYAADLNSATTPSSPLTRQFTRFLTEENESPYRTATTDRDVALSSSSPSPTSR